MSTPASFRTKVFVCYSHQDGEWLDRLRTHLKPLEGTYAIAVWDDTRIKPGAKWREEIRQAIRTARVAVLLISADFLASDFITTDELPTLLSSAEKEGATILPIILSPCRFLRTQGLSEFQSVNDPSKSLVSLPRGEQEAVFLKVSETIEDALISTTHHVTHEPPSRKANLETGARINSGQQNTRSRFLETSIARIPNNDLGYGIIAGGSYKGLPLEIVASAWIRYADSSWVTSGWLYAAPYSDVSHAVAFFKAHLRDDGSGYIHVLDSSNPVHVIEVSTATGFHREEEFCWDTDSKVQRTALWDFTWK